MKILFLFTDFFGMVAGNDRALCRCGIRIPSARNRCPAFDKDKYLQPMFGDVGQARTKAAMLLLPIATTSSRTCTKPTVACRTSSLSIFLYFDFGQQMWCTENGHYQLISVNICFYMSFKTDCLKLNAF